MKLSLSSARIHVLCAIVVMVVACGSDDRPASAAQRGAPDGSGESSTVDAQSTMHEEVRPNVATDPNFVWMRDIADHLEGFTRMASSAEAEASTVETRQLAADLRARHGAERDSVLAAMRRLYRVDYLPASMPVSRGMQDTLQALSGRRYDETFLRMVLRHHREGLTIIERSAGSLTRPEVRAFARTVI